MTILNQTEILSSGIPYWLELVTKIFICLSALFLLLVLIWSCDCSQWMFYCLVITSGLASICIIASLGFGIFTDNHTGRYRYECTINETTLINEIYEKYDVIERRGDIWVLEDKEC